MKKHIEVVDGDQAEKATKSVLDTAVSRKRKATDQAVLHQTGCHQESDIRQKK